jgi:hypothetical protein
VVNNWLLSQRKPLGTNLGWRAKKVKTFTDKGGAPLYHVVYLEPKGLVFVSGDERVEPIIAFAPAGVYDPSPTNPLGGIIGRDLRGRVGKVRALDGADPGLEPTAGLKEAMLTAQSKWADLTVLDPAGSAPFHLSTINDVRVPSFVESEWSDGKVGTDYCYNYYTPGHRPAGCFPVAMAQLMRYWQYPTEGIGMDWFIYFYSWRPSWDYTIGGDGSGGPYKWDLMALKPEKTPGLTVPQRQAIGALMRDAGLAAHAGYNYLGGKYTTDVYHPRLAAGALVNTFQYKHANFANVTIGSIGLTALYNMVNTNLDAGYPVILGIANSTEKHAVVADGYGYNAGTMYHHLNLGMGGLNSVDCIWYNLPNVDLIEFTMVKSAIYNIFRYGNGEVISGRVNTCGWPFEGATVTAQAGGESWTVKTSKQGIYAFPAIPSSTTFTITVTGVTGYQFTPQTVTTGTSVNNTTTTGNRWGIDFSGKATEWKTWLTGRWPANLLDGGYLELKQSEDGTSITGTRFGYKVQYLLVPDVPVTGTCTGFSTQWPGWVDFTLAIPPSQYGSAKLCGFNITGRVIFDGSVKLMEGPYTSYGGNYCSDGNFSSQIICK